MKRRTLPETAEYFLCNSLFVGYKHPFVTWRLNIVKKASNRRTWTSADVRTLKSLARRKTRAKKIAKELKRTEGATRQKAFSIGVSLDARP